MEAAAVSMSGISKSFGDVRVLDNVDFELRRGEIHALAGGNGAGKSTLMKILVGVYSPDEGMFEVDARPVRFDSIQDAREAGLGMVFQGFSLVPTLTVAQNVFLTREAHGAAGLLDDRESVRRTRELFRTMQVEVDPRRPLDELPTAHWQLTEIAKALSQNARVLIMDEPTASLAKTETVQLFALMRRLQEQGISIVYISHRMEEVFEICDRITVLRDGKRVMTEELEKLTMEQVIDQIVGRKLEQTMAWKERDVPAEAGVLLEVRGLSSGTKLHDIDLQLREGEILGLAGLMGSGRSELARALFGIDPIDSGEILIRGRRVSIRSPKDAIEAGIGMIPEDRRSQGLVLDHTIKRNFLLPLLSRLLLRVLGRFSFGGFLDDRKGDRLANAFVQRLTIRASSIDSPMRLLSGGNQQKVVIAKWLGTEPQILLMDEPTAGVDIGTKGEIVNIIRVFAEQGNGVLIISSELPELLAVSDRVLILRDGRVAHELGRREIQGEEELHHAVQGVV
jgi:ribose transport system ATP-binding protein